MTDALIQTQPAGAGGGYGRLWKAGVVQREHAGSSDTVSDQSGDPDNDPVFGLTDTQLAEMGQRVIDAWNEDKTGNKPWIDAADKDLKQIADRNVEVKNTPWPNASNIKYPQLAIACQKFNARAYPALVRGDQAVTSKVIGPDLDESKAQRAARVSAYLNYQIFYSMRGWEADTDRLLFALPAVGQGFRKLYSRPKSGKPQSEAVRAQDIHIPADSLSLHDAPRLTQERKVFPQEIRENQRTGVWRDTPLGLTEDERDKSRVILEHYGWWDLDDDGVEEPYIVTVDEGGSVLRVDSGWLSVEQDQDGSALSFKRWLPFASYGFMPDPEGGCYGLGFGTLIAPIMDSVDTALNQLADAGAAAAAGGGFLGSEIRLQQRGTTTMTIRPGEWKTIQATGDDIRKGFVERTLPAVSDVQLQQVQFLLSAASDITSATDVITADTAANTPVGTVMALVEQALLVFNAAYKRVYRGFKEEFGLLYSWNSHWGDAHDYARFCGFPNYMAAMHIAQGGQPPAPPPPQPGQPPQPQPPAMTPQQAAQQADQIAQQAFAMDFADDGFDIRPVGDPSTSTRMQELTRAQFLLSMAQFSANPGGLARGAAVAAGMDPQEAMQQFPDRPAGPPPVSPVDQSTIQLHQAQATLALAQAGKAHVDATTAFTEGTGPAADIDLREKAANAVAATAHAAERLSKIPGNHASAAASHAAAAVDLRDAAQPTQVQQ